VTLTRDIALPRGTINATWHYQCHVSH